MLIQLEGVFDYKFLRKRLTAKDYKNENENVHCNLQTIITPKITPTTRLRQVPFALQIFVITHQLLPLPRLTSTDVDTPIINKLVFTVAIYALLADNDFGKILYCEKIRRLSIFVMFN